MLKVVMLIIFSINLMGEVDIILNTFVSSNQAKEAKDKLENFISKEKIPAKVKVEKFKNIFYLKIGTFSDSIRDDEKLLATIGLNYPDMVIIPHTAKKVINNSSSNQNRVNNRTFFQKNSKYIQWLILVIMALWIGFILFLRFKTVKKVEKEQDIITKQQNSMEDTINQTKRMSNEI